MAFNKDALMAMFPNGIPVDVIADLATQAPRLRMEEIVAELAALETRKAGFSALTLDLAGKLRNALLVNRGTNTAPEVQAFLLKLNMQGLILDLLIGVAEAVPVELPVPLEQVKAARASQVP